MTKLTSGFTVIPRNPPCFRAQILRYLRFPEIVDFGFLDLESFLFEDIKRFLKNYVTLNRNHFKIYDIIILKNFIDIINPDVIYSFAKTTTNYALLINALRLNKIRLIKL